MPPRLSGHWARKPVGAIKSPTQQKSWVLARCASGPPSFLTFSDITILTASLESSGPYAMARARPEKAVRPCLDRLRLFARCELKQLCKKISDVSEHSDGEFYYLKKKKLKGQAQCSYDKMLID